MYLFSTLYHTPIQKKPTLAVPVPISDDILDREWETLSIIDEHQEEEQHTLLYNNQDSVSIPSEEKTNTTRQIQENQDQTITITKENIISPKKHNDMEEPYHYTSFEIPPLTIPDEKEVQVPYHSPYNDQPSFYTTTLSWTPVACKKEDDIESDFSNLFTEFIDFLFGPDVIDKIKEHHAEKPISV